MQMIMKKIGIILCVLCLLTGCAPKTDGEVQLYFTDRHRQVITQETRKVKTEETLIESAIRALLAGPKKIGNRRIIPEGTELLSIQLIGTMAEINLSAAFDTGTAGERLLSRYTLISTACAVAEVQKVKLFVEGKPLTSLEDGSPLGALGAVDVSLTGSGGGIQQLLTLYFPDINATFLVEETRQVTLTEGQSVAYAMVKEILQGPSSGQLAAPFSEKTDVLSVEMREGICFVNMNWAFLAENTGDREREATSLYSIVNALSQLPQVRGVRFLVEGKTVKMFGNHRLTRTYTENEKLYFKQN